MYKTVTALKMVFMVIIFHREAEGSETLTVINVYCPRADPEKPERKLFKLQFYKLLQSRAEAIVGPRR